MRVIILDKNSHLKFHSISLAFLVTKKDQKQISLEITSQRNKHSMTVFLMNSLLPLADLFWSMVNSRVWTISCFQRISSNHAMNMVLGRIKAVLYPKGHRLKSHLKPAASVAIVELPTSPRSLGGLCRRTHVACSPHGQAIKIRNNHAKTHWYHPKFSNT